MSLVEHATKELTNAGLFDADSDYEGELGSAVLELITAFSKQGHSGFSAHMTINVFNKLAQFQPLTPLTNRKEEWMEVSDNLHQSSRHPSCFSNDGGKTYYNLDDRATGLRKIFKKRKMYTALPADIIQA